MIDTIPTEYELDRDGHYIRVISAKNVNSPGYSHSILVRVGLGSQKVTYRTVTVDARISLSGCMILAFLLTSTKK